MYLSIPPPLLYLHIFDKICALIKVLQGIYELYYFVVQVLWSFSILWKQSQLFISHMQSKYFLCLKNNQVSRIHVAVICSTSLKYNHNKMQHFDPIIVTSMNICIHYHNNSEGYFTEYIYQPMHYFEFFKKKFTALSFYAYISKVLKALHSHFFITKALQCEF